MTIYPASTERSIRDAKKAAPREDYDVSGFPPRAQAILKGLKKYGMFVADNGGDWLLSIVPDRRLEGLDDLRKLKGADFEVAQTE